MFVTLAAEAQILINLGIRLKSMIVVSHKNYLRFGLNELW